MTRPVTPRAADPGALRGLPSEPDPREDFFLHGGEYLDHVDEPRPERCGTCAFRPRGPTVRPPDTSLRDLVRMTADYDGFVCHEQHHGRTLTCRGWLEHHRPAALAETPPRAARRSRGMERTMREPVTHDLSEAAVACLGRWFPGPRDELRSHEPHTVLTRHKAEMDELVAKGFLTVESFNRSGSVLYRPTPKAKGIGRAEQRRQMLALFAPASIPDAAP